MENIDIFENLDLFEIKNENKNPNLYELVKKYDALGLHISELSYRQTGRTTRMINCIVEHIKLYEHSDKILNLMIVGYNTQHIKRIKDKIIEKLEENNVEVLPRYFYGFKTEKCNVEFRSEENCCVSGVNYDEVYIDDVILDKKELN